jgi:hypothetical protein
MNYNAINRNASRLKTSGVTCRGSPHHTDANRAAALAARHFRRNRRNYYFVVARLCP